jgi:hypothetical protein
LICCFSGGGNGQRHLAFQHRHHSFHFEHGLEAGSLGGALLPILARLVEKLGDLGHLLIVSALGGGETRGAQGCCRAGDHFEDGGGHRAAASAEGGKDQVHGRRAIDGHVFPGPAVGVDEGRLAGNVLAFAAAEASAATTARGGEGHDTGDPIDAHHTEVLAFRVDGAERAQLRHELAQLAGIHGLAHGGDFGEPEFGGRIDHARIDAQPLAFDDARALDGGNPGADIGDPAIPQDHRHAFHFRAHHRVHVDVADDGGLGR